MDERDSNLTAWFRCLPALAVLSSCGIYASHFFFGGGAGHLILDSYAYLQLSNGQQTSVPFNSRIAMPVFASLISSAAGLSTSAVFKLLIPVALLVSLLAIRTMIRRRGGSPEWQAAILVAFGGSLAVTFGFTPVLVDPILLVLICLTLAALDSDRLVLALVLACVAALTKEYGVLLGLVCSLYAYRRGLRRLAGLALVLPLAALLVVLLVRQSGFGVGFGTWSTFASHLAFEYQLSVLRLRGPAEYSQLIYMWAWCGLWPVLLLSTYSFLSRYLAKKKLSCDELIFGVMLGSLPILLLGDWSRSLIVMVPFASIIATRSLLSKDRWFALLLGIGGLATSLARPFHGEMLASPFLTVSMTVISAVASLLLAMKFFRFAISERRSQPVAASPEAALP